MSDDIVEMPDSDSVMISADAWAQIMTHMPMTDERREREATLAAERQSKVERLLARGAPTRRLEFVRELDPPAPGREPASHWNSYDGSLVTAWWAENKEDLIYTIDSPSERVATLSDSLFPERVSYVAPLPGDRWLGARARTDYVEDARTNDQAGFEGTDGAVADSAWIIDSEGVVLAASCLGDALLAPVVSCDGRIWVTYFDEAPGRYRDWIARRGADGQMRKVPGSEIREGSVSEYSGYGKYTAGYTGMTVFDDALRVIGRHVPGADRGPSVLETYASHTDGESFWYVAYPSWEILKWARDGSESVISPDGLKGTFIIATDDGVARFSGPGAHRDSVYRHRDDGTLDEAVVVFPDGSPLVRGLITTWGQYLHYIDGTKWYRLTVLAARPSADDASQGKFVIPFSCLGLGFLDGEELFSNIEKLSARCRMLKAGSNDTIIWSDPTGCGVSFGYSNDIPRGISAGFWGPVTNRLLRAAEVDSPVIGFELRDGTPLFVTLAEAAVLDSHQQQSEVDVSLTLLAVGSIPADAFADHSPDETRAVGHIVATNDSYCTLSGVIERVEQKAAEVSGQLYDVALVRTAANLLVYVCWKDEGAALPSPGKRLRVWGMLTGWCPRLWESTRLPAPPRPEPNEHPAPGQGHTFEPPYWWWTYAELQEILVSGVQQSPVLLATGIDPLHYYNDEWLHPTLDCLSAALQKCAEYGFHVPGRLVRDSEEALAPDRISQETRRRLTIASAFESADIFDGPSLSEIAHVAAEQRSVVIAEQDAMFAKMWGDD